ncbi:MAG: ASCH domain-containing protein [Candidatus Paceibacterota bacterium]
MENKTYKLKIRAVDKDIFNAIKNGQKKVETRAAIENYRKIGKGDTIIFICGVEKLKKKVLGAALYKSIGAVFKKHKIKDVFPLLISIKEARRAYYGFPGYRDKIKKYGLVAWKLK